MPAVGSSSSRTRGLGVEGAGEFQPLGLTIAERSVEREGAWAARPTSASCLAAPRCACACCSQERIRGKDSRIWLRHPASLSSGDVPPAMTFSSAVSPVKGRRFWKVRASPHSTMRCAGSRADRAGHRQRDLAAVGLFEAGQDVEQGGLSRAVGSDDPHDLALADLQSETSVRAFTPDEGLRDSPRIAGSWVGGLPSPGRPTRSMRRRPAFNSISGRGAPSPRSPSGRHIIKMTRIAPARPGRNVSQPGLRSCAASRE